MPRMSGPFHFDEALLPLFGEAEPATACKSGKVPSYLTDHRKRLRERFLAGGDAAVPDYELLELVLFRAIPRKDVKPIARRLLDVFGDFNHVLSADPHRLQGVEGVGLAVMTELKIVEAAAHRLARSRVIRRHVISSWDSLLTYCRTAMAHRDIEQFRVLFLDAKNILIEDEEQARGTVNHVPVYPREVMKRALELNASPLILVHNHPSGSPEPSRADIQITKNIAEAGRLLGVHVHDHVIIGREGHTSLRAKGVI